MERKKTKGNKEEVQTLPREGKETIDKNNTKSRKQEVIDNMITFCPNFASRGERDDR